MDNAETLLSVAETIIDVLRKRRVDAVVIGAVALAAYRYVRQTDDIDLGVNADIETMNAVTEDLRAAGYAVEFRKPDADDPLGGVIDVTGSFGLLQIINYGDRFPAVIEDALRESKLVVREGSLLRLAPIPQLVALKLYAGGFKSKADIVELLSRNPDVDLEEIRAVCGKYGLKGIDELIAELKEM